MNTKKLLLLTLLLTGVMVLAACASKTEPEETQEPVAPTEPVAYPDPQIEPEEPVAYPYPEPETGAQPINPDAYPAPGETVSDEPVALEPYPGTGSDETPEKLLLADFEVSPTDKKRQSGGVYIHGTDIVMKESYPVQVELVITGDLPTPCHQLRVVTSDPDENGHIQIRVYSVNDPETMCIQMLKPFEAVVPLGDFTEGNFTYSINDNEFNGKFQLP